MTDETPVVEIPDEPKSSPKKNPTTPGEIVANKDFISWKYPPYCELCNVIFSGEPCAETHFKSEKHRQRLRIWKIHHDLETEDDEQKKTTSSKNVVCDVCWKEMNTQKILDQHCASPAHIKEMQGRDNVQKLKEDYRQLKQI